MSPPTPKSSACPCRPAWPGGGDQICTFNDDLQGTAAITFALRVTGERLSDEGIVVHGANTSGAADLIRANTAAGSRASASTGRLLDERPPDLGVSCNVILQVRTVVQVPDWSRNCSWGRRCAVDWVLPVEDVALRPFSGSSRGR